MFCASSPAAMLPKVRIVLQKADKDDFAAAPTLLRPSFISDFSSAIFYS
jgi:hypothetical protein